MGPRLCILMISAMMGRKGREMIHTNRPANKSNVRFIILLDSINKGFFRSSAIASVLRVFSTVLICCGMLYGFCFYGIDYDHCAAMAIAWAYIVRNLCKGNIIIRISPYYN